MKKLKQAILPMLLMATQQVFGQIPAIDSLKFLPESPVAGDEVKVIIYTTFPYGDCDLANHSMDVQDGSIVLDLVYTMGAAAYICHSTDTVTIGLLEKGEYPLEVNLYVETGLTGELTLEDTKSTIIPVSLELGVVIPSADSKIRIYPNPFYDELSIVTDLIIDNAAIFSVIGEKTVLCEACIPGQLIDLSNLQNGAYFLMITDKDGNRYSQKIIKIAP